jgi:hypothetical protein
MTTNKQNFNEIKATELPLIYGGTTHPGRYPGGCTPNPFDLMKLINRPEPSPVIL